MKKSCLGLIFIWLVCGYGYSRLLIGTTLADAWWVPVLLGFSVAVVFANAQGILLTLSHYRASRRSRDQWRDGDRIVVSGRLQALSKPLIAPISGAPATIVEYRIERRGDGESSTARADYRGCMMVPCIVQCPGTLGQVPLVGFPLLPDTDGVLYTDDAAYRRVATFLLNTPTTTMPASPLAALAELNAILKDDDGLVAGHFRHASAPDYYIPKDLPAEAGEALEPEAADPLDDPVQHIVSDLQSGGYGLRENTFNNGCEVTAMGTYRYHKGQINIGSGFSSLHHGLHRGPVGAVLRTMLLKALIVTVIFCGLCAGGNYYVLREIGATPGSVWQQINDRF